MTRFALMITVAVAGLILAAPVMACDECGCQTGRVFEMNEDGTMAVPEGHPIVLPEGMHVELRQVPETPCAYLEGKIMGDMDALFDQLYDLALEQGLLTDDTMWGSLYPTDLTQGVDEETPVYCGITIPPGAEVSAPLLTGMLPAGNYLMVQHWGDYMEMEKTYNALYTWAAENGIQFGYPTFMNFVTDPDTTPVEEWLTEIYLPFDHEAMKAMAMSQEDEADEDHGDDHEHGHDHDHNHDH
ncbi:GyrI-like domain-containing protein [bacterium]|nr:GyrI-like domain-containing protein [bacterium]